MEGREEGREEVRKEERKGGRAPTMMVLAVRAILVPTSCRHHIGPFFLIPQCKYGESNVGRLNSVFDVYACIGRKTAGHVRLRSSIKIYKYASYLPPEVELSQPL